MSALLGISSVIYKCVNGLPYTVYHVKLSYNLLKNMINIRLNSSETLTRNLFLYIMPCISHFLRSDFAYAKELI